jgi:carbonic anhydrase
MTDPVLPASTAQGLYSRQPGFAPEMVRDIFQTALNVKTFVVYCPDPRARGVPAAVAKEFGEVCPGEIVLDENGNKVGFTTNLGQLISAGGRAVDALRSVTALNHLLGFGRVVVVHHTFCGMTAFTPESVTNAYLLEHGHDISQHYHREDLYIGDFEESLKYDVAFLRNSPAVPPEVQLFGYVYDINTETLHKVVEDLGTGTASKPPGSAAAQAV